MGKNNMRSELKTMSNPKYRGRHVIMIAGKVFAASTGQQAVKIFDKVTKKYAGETPTIAYVPKAETFKVVLENHSAAFSVK